MQHVATKLKAKTNDAELEAFTPLLNSYKRNPTISSKSRLQPVSLHVVFQSISLVSCTCCSLFSSLIGHQSVAVLAATFIFPFCLQPYSVLSFSSLFSPVPSSFSYVCSMETLCCTSVSNSVPLYFPFCPLSFFPLTLLFLPASSPAVVSSVLMLFL